MAKSTSRYVCQNCGTVHLRWAGKCEACGEWNTIIEEAAPSAELPKATGGKGGREITFTDLHSSKDVLFRLKTGSNELDRVTGGGLVAGSVLLVGGDPGIGKSTLLLQVVGALSEIVNMKGNPVRCVYISGEEAESQVQLRAARLGLSNANVELASAASVRDIVATLDNGNPPDVVVIDSIQTMYVDTLDYAAGSVGQVRAAASELIRLAKKRGFILFLVGHVTKEGAIAGPRVLEHMVDTVLYFEGDRGHNFRILRAVKNRFGATDEIGVFEMRDSGLAEVPNPSSLFLAERRGNVSGSCVYAGIEGSRPILVEVQALVSPSFSGSARRSLVGWDSARLSMILAVLEARCGLKFSDKDVFLNIAGGLKVTEPSADLAVAAALISSATNIPVPANLVMFGEVGLSGEIRAVSQAGLRLKEAAKLGFEKALIPPKKSKVKLTDDIQIKEIGNLHSLVDMFKNA
jgi:DNA repair protein RadA/Sms